VLRPDVAELLGAQTTRITGVSVVDLLVLFVMVEARRPSGAPAASTTYQLRSMSAGPGVNVLWIFGFMQNPLTATRLEQTPNEDTPG
jgi:predicted membrane protein